MLDSKLINIITELEKDEVIRAGEFKALISGEGSTAERKYQNPLQIRNFATFIIATNYLPKVDDTSDAFFRRIIVIPFERCFSKEEQDPDLINKLELEIPEILNILIEVARKVLKQRGFDVPNNSVLALEEWRKSLDPLERFVQKRCELIPYAWVSYADLYDAYEDWCDENSVCAVDTKVSFTKNIRNRFNVFNKRKGGNGDRGLRGIGLRQL